MLRAVARLVLWLSDTVARLCLAAACGFMLVMLAMVAIQVIARYGFSSPPQWTEEIARYAMVWASLLGATVSFHRGADPVLIGWSEARALRAGHWLVVAQMAAVFVFVIPVVTFGIGFLERASIRVTEATRMPLALVESIVPLFAAIVALHALARLLKPLHGTPPEASISPL